MKILNYLVQSPLASAFNVQRLNSITSMATSRSGRVEHCRETREFFIRLNDEQPLSELTNKAVINYQWLDSDALDLHHTGVPKAFEGRGIAKELAAVAFQYCVDNTLRMKLTCWYLEAYYKKNATPALDKLVMQ